MLPALTAGLVRYVHIDGLNKLSQRIRVKLLHPHIAFGFLNELFNALVLPLLYFNFLLQLDSFCFELFLFRLIALAQHIEAFVIQLAAGVVLVDLDEQPLQFRDTLFIALKPSLADIQLLCAFYAELGLHDRAEVIFIPQDIPRDQLHVFQDHTLQNGLPDVVCRALVFVLPVKGTIKECTLRFVIVGCAIVQLFSAV